MSVRKKCIEALLLIALLLMTSTSVAAGEPPVGEMLEDVRVAGPWAGCAAQSDIPQAECEALVALYNATDGPNWIDHSGWLENDAPCG